MELHQSTTSHITYKHDNTAYYYYNSVIKGRLTNMSLCFTVQRFTAAFTHESIVLWAEELTEKPKSQVSTDANQSQMCRGGFW